MWIRKSQMPIQHALSSFVTERHFFLGSKFWFETAYIAVVYGWDVSLSFEKNYFNWKKNKLSKKKK